MNEQIPDKFEKALRRWEMEGKILDLVREAGQECDLDPALIAAVEDAIQEGDFDSIIEAMTEWWQAVGAAKGLL